MARDEKERKKKEEKEKEKEKEEKGKQHKRGHSWVNKSEPAKSLRRVKLTKPGSAHSATSLISGRVVPSIEGYSGKSTRVVSGNAVRTGGREKPALVGKSKAPPIPPAWKPTPTKTSILREKAIKSAREAKLKASSLKATNTGSPTRSAGFSFPRASPSRSLVPTPEKDRRPAASIAEDGQGPEDLCEHGQEEHQDSSSDASGSSEPSRHQRKDDYQREDRKDTSRGADPILTLRPLHGPARRPLYRTSTEDSEALPSELPAVVSPSRRLRKRSNTPRSPSTNQNEEFSPFFESHLEKSSSKTEEPSVVHREYRRSVSPSHQSRHRGKQSSSSSGRTLVNSPARTPSFDPPFEDFGSSDEYGHAPTSSPVRVGPKSATLPTYSPQKEAGSPLCIRPNGKIFHTISLQERKPNKISPSYADEKPSDEDDLSEVKPILTISRAKGRYQRGSESRESVKSVRWDPAVLVVGRRIPSTTEAKVGPEDLEVPNQNSGDFPGGFLEDYLNNVTQSFAKLKKNNPRIINQILAALRGLKSDDESSTDTEQRRKKQLNTKSVSETKPVIITPEEKVKAEATLSRPSEQADPAILARGKLISLIGHIKKPNLAETRSSKHGKSADTKKDRRWGEVHPSILFKTPTRPIDHQKTLDQGVENLNSYAEALRSPVRTLTDTASPDKFCQAKAPPTPASSIKPNSQSSPKYERLMESSVSAKLNPLAPVFQGFSSRKAVAERPNRDELSTLSGRSRLWAPHLKEPWREANFRLAPAKGAVTETAHPKAHAHNSPRKLDPKDAIWINKSQSMRGEFDYQPESASTENEQLFDSNKNFNITPIPCPPQMFRIPSGYIPLVPYSSFLPPTISYLPQQEGLLFSTPGLPPPPGPEDIAAPDFEELSLGLAEELSEDQPGRVAKRLERSWSEKTLARFQARYPLTGTRVATPAAALVPIPITSISAPLGAEEVPKAPVASLVPAPAQAGQIPMLRPPVVEQPGFDTRAQYIYQKKHGGHPQQLARKQRASEIQMELEMKILDYKEKKAAKKKELEKQLINSVTKSISMTRSQGQSQATAINPAPVSTKATSKTAMEWPSLPEWKKSIQCLPEKKDQKETLGQAPPITSFERLLKGPAGAPKHVWEYLSLDLSESRPFAQAQGLSRFDEGTPLLIDPLKQTLFDEIEEMQLLQDQAIAKPLDGNAILPIVTSPTEGQRATSNSCWNRLSTEELRSRAMLDCKSQEAQRSHTRNISRESQPVNTTATDKKSWEVFSLEEWKNQPPAGSLGSSRSSTTKAIEDSLPDYPAAMIRKSFEILSRGEIQDQVSHEEDLLLPTTSTSEVSPPNQLVAIESQEEGLVLPTTVPNEDSVPTHVIEDKVENVWELLSVEEWRSQASGKIQQTNSMPPTTRTASEGSFRAPSYLWDFLNLEFSPEEFTSLNTKLPQSPRSSSGASSEALSETLIEARKGLYLPKPKRRGHQAPERSEDSASTGTSRSSMENVETPYQQIRLDFDWVPPIRTRTIDVSLDNSDLLLGASPSSSEKSKGKSIAMAEGSAAEEARSSKGKSTGQSRISSTTSISTGLPSDFGDGGEIEYNYDEEGDEMF